MRDLSERLWNVRITCGDWAECLSPSVTVGTGVTGIVLDPPYSTGEHSVKYSADKHKSAGRDIADEVRQWAITVGESDEAKAGILKIALCGYESDKHPMPPNWITYKWKARGGYGSHGQVTREAIDPNQK